MKNSTSPKSVRCARHSPTQGSGEARRVAAIARLIDCSYCSSKRLAVISSAADCSPAHGYLLVVVVENHQAVRQVAV